MNSETCKWCLACENKLNQVVVFFRFLNFPFVFIRFECDWCQHLHHRRRHNLMLRCPFYFDGVISFGRHKELFLLQSLILTVQVHNQSISCFFNFKTTVLISTWLTSSGDGQKWKPSPINYGQTNWFQRHLWQSLAIQFI